MTWQLFWQLFMLFGWVGFLVSFVKSVDAGKKGSGS